MSAVSTAHLQKDSNSTYVTLGLSASLSFPPLAALHLLATISHLGGPGDHVLDEVPVARCVNDGDVVLGGLKFPQRDVNGDATLTLGLQLVQHPGVFEGPLPHLANTKARAGEKPKPIALVLATHPTGNIPSSHRQRATLQTLKVKCPKFSGSHDLFMKKYRRMEILFLMLSSTGWRRGWKKSCEVNLCVGLDGQELEPMTQEVSSVKRHRPAPMLGNHAAVVESCFLLNFHLLTEPVRQLVSGKGHRCTSEPTTDRSVGGERVKRK